MKTVRVILCNRVAYIKEPFPYEELDKFFSYYKPGYRYAPAYIYKKWDGKVHFLSSGNSIPAGLFRALQEKIEQKLNIKFKVTEECEPVGFKADGVKSNRDYQNECLGKMTYAAQLGGGLVTSATGTGKTFMAGMFFSHLIGDGIFIVDELTLLSQAKKELQKVMGEKVGIVGNSIFKPRRITVATIQTMHRHRHRRDFRQWTHDIQAILIDEVHTAMNRRNFQTVSNISPPAVFGLTATLELKKKHVRTRAFALTGPVVYEYPIAQATKEGNLTGGVVLQVVHSHYHEKNKGFWGYNKDYKELIVDCKKRNRLIRDIVKSCYKRGKYTVVLVERVLHLKALSGQLRAIPHRTVWGHVDVKDRTTATKRMDKGKLKLILANKVFKKGINIKRVDVVVDAAGMKSANDAIQKFGRGVRLHPEKRGLIYFDIGDKENRFEEATKKRKRAFRSQKIEVRKFNVTVNECFGTSQKKWIGKLIDDVDREFKNKKGR